MSSDQIIVLENVWKKYSMHQSLNNSLREELVSVLTARQPKSELRKGEFWALQDISLNVRRGECVGLYGPNGSGKSTIFKLISNVTYPTKGRLRVSGRVAPLIELGAGMHPDLTGMENIFMNGTILGMTIKELKAILPEIIEFTGLRDFINVPVKKYSSGMYLRLAFSIAVHSSAKIFLLDEILGVGDESFQAKCNNKIQELKNDGRTILIVSHDLNTMKRITDKILHIDKGVIHAA